LQAICIRKIYRRPDCEEDLLKNPRRVNKNLIITLARRPIAMPKHWYNFVSRYLIERHGAVLFLVAVHQVYRYTTDTAQLPSNKAVHTVED
jgi:hypothetical protein